ncbi:MAG: hypothetical protein ACRDQJ_06235 [Pseudonocardiaceae bacterium]
MAADRAGRGAECDQRLICRRNGPAGIVLAGAAGVGKTRLAREALAAAQRRGALTRWAVATASARALPLARSRRRWEWSARIRHGWFAKPATRCWPAPKKPG